MIATIAAKELKALFASPLAWIILAIFQFILAWIFLARVDAFLGVQSQLNEILNPPGVTEYVAASLFSAAAIIFMMIVPLFTMRSIAEELRNQTLVLLFSAPITTLDIVAGKFLGLLLFLSTAILLLSGMALTLGLGAKIDFGLLVANLLGIGLLAASFAAIGLYISSLTAHPFLAGIGGIFVLLGLWAMSFSSEKNIFQALSPLSRFESFNSGIIDSGDAAYFVIVTVLFLALSARRLESR